MASTDSLQESTGWLKGKTFGKAGMRIIIKDLDYSVKSNVEKGKELFLLSKVSAAYEPRQMSALMGPSGSGKTTLLDLLAGRKTVGKMDGTLLYSGNKPTQQFLRRYTGYVEQFDTLIGLLTVQEMLLYTAELKRPTSEPLTSKATAVDELIEKLGLGPCKDVRIGSALSKGISGGQAKRVNIGIALVSNPRVLLLDEPTTGLDSFSANEVMTVVRELLDYNVTVVATIHSPTQYAFNLFDRLLMLVRGRVVYYGDRGQAALEYVNSLEATREHGAAYHDNDAEYLTDLFTEADRHGRGGVYADAYEASDLKKANDGELQALLDLKVELSEATKAELAVKRATVTPWWWGLKVYLKYRTTKNYQDPSFLGPRIGDKILMGLIIMSLFWGIGDQFSPDNVFNICAVLFLWCTLPAFGAAAYVPALFLERPLFIRERNDGLYRTFTYLAAKMLDEIMITLVGTLLIAIMVWFGVQMQGNFALFWLVYMTILSIGISTAYAFAAIAPTIDVANAVVPLIMVVMLFFSGFLFRLADLPPWWKWFSYLDFLRYAWAAVVLNHFSSEDPAIFGPGSPTVTQYFDMTITGMWGYWAISACFVPFCVFCAWLGLTFKRHEKR